MIKKRLLILLSAALFLFAGCQMGDSDSSGNSSQEEKKEEVSYEVRTYDENDGYSKEVKTVEISKRLTCN